MKKVKSTLSIKTLTLALAMLVGASCTIEDQLDNPSSQPPSQAGNEYLFNGIQLSLGALFINATQFGMDNTRMLAMFGSNYGNAYSANTFNGMWFNAYSDILVNGKLLLEKSLDDPATSGDEYDPFYQGATRIIMAYTMFTLVDYFGDVPYSQALGAPAELNPMADNGEDVYADAMDLLNDGITQLRNVDPTRLPLQDIYYGHMPANQRADSWIKFANTLKMRAFLQTRLVTPTVSNDSITALIAAGELISNRQEEFVFRTHGNSLANPNTYHPWFFGNYQTSASQYMSNSYMYELFDGKSINGALSTVRDPRIRFYFYRQTTSPSTNVNELSCSSASAPPAHYPVGTPYCQVGAGYWGRDHLNIEGIPPDGLLRTIYGLYPAGGAFDESQNVGVDELGFLAAGGGGRGILPIMMLSYVRFMTAEYLYTLQSDVAGARAELDNAIRESIDRVISFNPAVLPTSGPVLNTFNAAAINAYVNRVLTLYDDGDPNNIGQPIPPNATFADSQLDVITKEYWVALWGNGIDAYNTVRRTGKPANLQPALNPSPGDFYRSFTYPAVYVIRNNNADQKPNNKVQVFWDSNPANFIK